MAASHPKIAALMIAMKRSVRVASAVNEARNDPADPPATITLKK